MAQKQLPYKFMYKGVDVIIKEKDSLTDTEEGAKEGKRIVAVIDGEEQMRVQGQGRDIDDWIDAAKYAIDNGDYEE